MTIETTARDYEAAPITVDEAIQLFKDESFDLALASAHTIELACDRMEVEGAPNACDIVARWDDYQEELRCMAAEFC